MSPISAGQRSIKTGKEYEQYFPISVYARPVPGKTIRLLSSDASVAEVVKNMAQIVRKYKAQTLGIARVLQRSTRQETVHAIWTFIYEYIQYKQDPNGMEVLRTPLQTWRDRKEGVDCDDMSILAASILSNLDIPWSFRIIKNGGPNFEHVYVTIPMESGVKGLSNRDYYVLDGVVTSGPDQEAPFTAYQDFPQSSGKDNLAGLPVYQLGSVSSLGAISPRQVTIRGFAPAPIAVGGAANPDMRYQGKTFVYIDPTTVDSKFNRGEKVIIAGDPRGYYNGEYKVLDWIWYDSAKKQYIKGFCIDKQPYTSGKHFEDQATLYIHGSTPLNARAIIWSASRFGFIQLVKRLDFLKIGTTLMVGFLPYGAIKNVVTYNAWNKARVFTLNFYQKWGNQFGGQFMELKEAAFFEKGKRRKEILAEAKKDKNFNYYRYYNNWAGKPDPRYQQLQGAASGSPIGEVTTAVAIATIITAATPILIVVLQMLGVNSSCAQILQNPPEGVILPDPDDTDIYAGGGSDADKTRSSDLAGTEADAKRYEECVRSIGNYIGGQTTGGTDTPTDTMDNNGNSTSTLLLGLGIGLLGIFGISRLMASGEQKPEASPEAPASKPAGSKPSLEGIRVRRRNRAGAATSVTLD